MFEVTVGLVLTLPLWPIGIRHGQAAQGGGAAVIDQLADLRDDGVLVALPGQLGLGLLDQLGQALGSALEGLFTCAGDNPASLANCAQCRG